MENIKKEDELLVYNDAVATEKEKATTICENVNDLTSKDLQYLLEDEFCEFFFMCSDYEIEKKDHDFDTIPLDCVLDFFMNINTRLIIHHEMLEDKKLHKRVLKPLFEDVKEAEKVYDFYKHYIDFINNKEWENLSAEQKNLIVEQSKNYDNIEKQREKQDHDLLIQQQEIKDKFLHQVKQNLDYDEKLKVEGDLEKQLYIFEKKFPKATETDRLNFIDEFYRNWIIQTQKYEKKQQTKNTKEYLLINKKLEKEKKQLEKSYAKELRNYEQQLKLHKKKEKAEEKKKREDLRILKKQQMQILKNGVVLSNARVFQDYKYVKEVYIYNNEVFFKKQENINEDPSMESAVLYINIDQQTNNPNNISYFAEDNSHVNNWVFFAIDLRSHFILTIDYTTELFFTPVPEYFKIIALRTVEGDLGLYESLFLDKLEKVVSNVFDEHEAQKKQKSRFLKNDKDDKGSDDDNDDESNPIVDDSKDFTNSFSDSEHTFNDHFYKNDHYDSFNFFSDLYDENGDSFNYENTSQKNGKLLNKFSLTKSRNLKNLKRNKNGLNLLKFKPFLFLLRFYLKSMRFLWAFTRTET